jgi:maltooligosyltrehalose trehalohydrolase
VVADIVSAAKAGGQARTTIYVCAENDAQETRVVAPQEAGGFGCDAAWNDDFHHAARVALTGKREAYYHDFTGSPQELISALKWGYLYQGQYYASLGKQRGQSVLDFGAHHFVTYLENHDQISASRTGARLGKLGKPSAVRALTTAWLLAPPTPLLFQGQEYDASTPFLFFADHEPGLAKLVARGRREFLKQFQSIADDGERAALDDPASPETFAKCKLDPRELARNARALAFHGELLRLRCDDPVFGSQRAVLHAACLGSLAFLLRFRSEEGERLVVVNLGPDLLPASLAEPLLAPPSGTTWELIFASEDPRYGGEGQRTPHEQGRWALTASSASVFAARSVPPFDER